MHLTTEIECHPEPPPLVCSPQQLAVVEAALAGRNVCVTGNAGTGKSFLFRELRRVLGDRLHITASTGLAALNVGGGTLHSWAGLGIGDRPAGAIMEKLGRYATGKETLDRVRKAEVLAIDEISMVSGKLLALFNDLCRMVRRSDEPFGGLQLLVFGDFLQLPPIDKDTKGQRDFAFLHPVWREAGFETHLLTKTFRQEDERFSRVLNFIRFGEVNDEVGEFLWERCQATDTNPALAPCHLHTHNKGVNLLNNGALSKLKGEYVSYAAVDRCEDEKAAKDLESHCGAPATLVLKEGARVMLLKNLSPYDGLVNGAMGVVTRLGTPSEGLVTVKFDSGAESTLNSARWEVKRGTDIVATRDQIPLRLAYAATVHKCQGMTLDKVSVNVADAFDSGQAYVAMSRVRTPGGLFFASPKMQIFAHPDAVEFYRKCACPD